ncbi:MAG TPA: hypothetical protein VN634_19490 [Candidatus Limnocylindrales bacterium]|nr:hypothetical protein [Candidatus Limnocylindrales bacterium]
MATLLRGFDPRTNRSGSIRQPMQKKPRWPADDADAPANAAMTHLRRCVGYAEKRAVLITECLGVRARRRSRRANELSDSPAGFGPAYRIDNIVSHFS